MRSRNVNKEEAQVWNNIDNTYTKAQQTLTNLKELRYNMEKEQNIKELDKERFIQKLQKRIMCLTDQNAVLKNTIALTRING